MPMIVTSRRRNVLTADARLAATTLARGLRHVAIAGSTGLVDVVTRNALATTGAAQRIVEPFGRRASRFGDSSGSQYVSVPAYMPGAAQSLLWFGVPRGVGPLFRGAIADTLVAESGGAYYIRLSGTAGTYGTYRTDYPVAIAVGGFYDTGGGGWAWIDGQLAYQNGIWWVAESEWRLHRNGPYPQGVDAECYLAASWDRLLSPAEFKSVTADPWQLFAPVRTPRYVSSASGTTYNSSLSESAVSSDLYATLFAVLATLAETATSADAGTTLGVMSSSVTETSAGTDTTAAVSAVLGALVEGGTGVDTLTSTISGAGVYDVALLESVTAADAETTGGVFYSSVSEQGVGAEALSTGGVFYVTLADSGAGTDVLSGHLPTFFSAALSESVSALDVMVSTFPAAGTLWTAMDTAAASGWTAVATTTGTWTIVPTT